MSDILETSKQFLAGESVTHTGLNNIIGGTSFVTGVEKTADESTIIVDPTGGYLKAGVMQEANIGDNQIKFKKMQKIGSPKVIGNLTGSNADPRAIDVDTVVDGTTGASDDSLSTTKAIKDYVDAQLLLATPNIEYETYGQNKYHTFTAENTWRNFAIPSVSITPRLDNSKFRISGHLCVGFTDVNKDYGIKVVYENLSQGGGVQDFNMPEDTAIEIANRFPVHFTLGSENNNNNQIITFGYDIIGDEITSSAGDILRFRLMVAGIDTTSTLYLNRSEDDTNNNDHPRCVSTFNIQEI